MLVSLCRARWLRGLCGLVIRTSSQILRVPSCWDIKAETLAGDWATDWNSVHLCRLCVMSGVFPIYVRPSSGFERMTHDTTMVHTLDGVALRRKRRGPEACAVCALCWCHHETGDRSTFAEGGRIPSRGSKISQELKVLEFLHFFALFCAYSGPKFPQGVECHTRGIRIVFVKKIQKKGWATWTTQNPAGFGFFTLGPSISSFSCRE